MSKHTLMNTQTLMNTHANTHTLTNKNAYTYTLMNTCLQKHIYLHISNDVFGSLTHIHTPTHTHTHGSPMKPKMSLMVGTKMTSRLVLASRTTVIMMWRIQLNSLDAHSSWLTEVRIYREGERETGM